MNGWIIPKRALCIRIGCRKLSEQPAGVVKRLNRDILYRDVPFVLVHKEVFMRFKVLMVALVLMSLTSVKAFAQHFELGIESGMNFSYLMGSDASNINAT